MKSKRTVGLPQRVAFWGCLVVGVLAGGAAADEDARPTISPEQIEADWLRQDVVRELPPAEPYRRKPPATRDDATGAVDGVKDGTYGFHTDRDDGPWWQVDLGEPVPLGRIAVYNRCDGNVEARAARLQVLLSADGTAWTETPSTTSTRCGWTARACGG